jgi:hypothetical protein
MWSLWAEVPFGDGQLLQHAWWSRKLGEETSLRLWVEGDSKTNELKLKEENFKKCLVEILGIM